MATINDRLDWDCYARLWADAYRNELRRADERRRRASQIHAASTARVTAKHETGPARTEPASTTYTECESGSGCTTECA